MITFVNDFDYKDDAFVLIDKHGNSFYYDNNKETIVVKDKNQKEIANELKSVFSDVKVKGKKVQSIVINRINQVTNGLRITEVVY